MRISTKARKLMVGLVVSSSVLAISPALAAAGPAASFAAKARSDTALAFGFTTTASAQLQADKVATRAEKVDVVNAEGGITRLYNSLDASTGMPKGMTIDWIRQQGRRNGASDADLAFMISAANSDPCANEGLKALCAYAGPTTIRKIRNYSAMLKLSGASDQQILQKIEPLMQYGIDQNLEKHYGKGLKDTEKNKSNRLSAKGDRQNKLLCLGLQTAVDQKQINSTNPIYGRQYRLVTCAAGLNWRQTFHFLWWDFSIQLGAVVTHSRMSRRVLGLWHLTGADNQICATAKALNNTNSSCDSYSWSSPFKAAADVIVDQQNSSVYANGQAKKLGQNFANTINF